MRTGGGRLTAARRIAARVNWGIADQAVQSLTNFALALLVVRSVPAAEFGMFSIVVVLHVLSVGVLRAANTEPLTICFGGDEAAVRGAAARAIGCAVVSGSVLGCLTAAVAVLVGGTLGTVLGVLALTYPLLMVQDATRIIAFAMGRPRAAALYDIGWCLGSALVVALVLLPAEDPPLWFYVAAWLVPGAIAGVAATWFMGLRADVLAVAGWLRESRHLGVPLTVNFVLMAAPPYLLFAFAPLFTSLVELGHARAGFIPFGVFGVVLQGSWLLLLPFAARRPPRQIHRMALVASLLLAIVAAIWGTVVVVLTPDSVGTFLMGAEWIQTQQIQLLFAIAVVAQAISLGPQVALKALGEPRRLVRVQMVTAPLILGGGVLLGSAHGGLGMTAAMLFGDVGLALLAWFHLRAAVAARR